MNHFRLVSALLGVCLGLGLACGSPEDIASDDMASDDIASDDMASDDIASEDPAALEIAELDEEAEAEAELGSLEQALGSCMLGCTVVTLRNLTGQCCSCNGIMTSFKPVIGIPNVFVCQ